MPLLCLPSFFPCHSVCKQIAPDSNLSNVRTSKQTCQKQPVKSAHVRSASTCMTSSLVQGGNQVQSLTLSQQEKELRATVSKLVHTEQAQEALYTCMACVSLLKNPVVCTPCGHTFCYGCLMKAKVGEELVCPECNNLPITGYVENRSLEGLVTKYEYRMGALRSLQRILR